MAPENLVALILERLGIKPGDQLLVIRDGEQTSITLDHIWRCRKKKSDRKLVEQMPLECGEKKIAYPITVSKG